MPLAPSLALLLPAALAQPFDLLVEPPEPLTPAAHDALLERAAALSPPDASSVRLWAESGGVLVPLESLLPPAPRPPRKRGEPPADESKRSPPADLPGEAQGFLSGKAVYLSQCHGWIWYDSLGRFSTQRGNTYDVVEDFLNPEGMDQYLVPYLENAGARVFTVKERDLQSLSAIADDGSADYEEEGSGFEDGPAGFADRGPWSYGDNPFEAGTTRRFPADGGGVARWTPEVPADGWYAVYVSWAQDPGNAPDAHYRIAHPGGVIDRYVDQREHGSTWHYLETLWLPEGRGGLVVELVGDSSSAGSWLSADAVRVGGGMGDVSRHGQTTGRPRWEEGAILNVQWNGAPSSVYDPYGDGDGSDPSSRSLWAAWEHPEGEPAVYLSWHSNACDYCGANGTSTYIYEGSAGSAYPGSSELANHVQDELISSIRALWDPDWSDRGVRSAAFSEVNPSLDDEMPAVLVELGFHDSEYDVSLLKEPDFRRDAARAMYRGIARYFAEQDGRSPDYLPEPPDHLALRHGEDGRLVASWEPGPSGAPYGDPATSYLLYTSPDGRSWDEGTEVEGTSATVDARPGQAVYVRVAARNAGGLSFPSETLGARRSPEGWAPVLVVSAFDRLEASTLVWEDLGDDLGWVQRMLLRRMNAFDTAVAHGEAIDAAGYPFDAVSDEAFDALFPDAGALLDAGYGLVVWVAGEESTHDVTFTPAEQEVLRGFVEGGGALLASGAEILWDLDEKGSDEDRAFAEEVLGALMAEDDAGTTQATGAGLLDGLRLDFGEEDGAPYPVEYPDVLDSSREALATYATGGLAGVLGGNVALFGFPFECIGDPSVRAELMARLLPVLLPGYEPPEDTGWPDTGAAGGWRPPGERVPLREGGCGCTSGGGAAALLPLPLLLALLRRRRA